MSHTFEQGGLNPSWNQNCEFWRTQVWSLYSWHHKISAAGGLSYSSSKYRTRILKIVCKVSSHLYHNLGGIYSESDRTSEPHLLVFWFWNSSILLMMMSNIIHNKMIEKNSHYSLQNSWNKYHQVNFSSVDK